MGQAAHFGIERLRNWGGCDLCRTFLAVVRCSGVVQSLQCPLQEMIVRHQRQFALSTGVAMLPAALFIAAALQGSAVQAQTAAPVPTLPPAAQPTAPAEIQNGGPATRADPPRAADPASPSPQTVLPAPQPGAGDRGVIAPPRSTDPGLTVSPPANGMMPVIPPPGAPGGDQRVVPK